jgi:hypothetical protein
MNIYILFCFLSVVTANLLPTGFKQAGKSIPETDSTSLQSMLKVAQRNELNSAQSAQKDNSVLGGDI